MNPCQMIVSSQLTKQGARLTPNMSSKANGSDSQWYNSTSSLEGKKYNVNMLNIGQDDFAKFEQVKAGLYSTAVGLCFNQMTASKGIKLFGTKAVAAMFKEYTQVDSYLKVFGNYYRH